MSDKDYSVGRGKPPKSTQFPPGVSGFAGRRRPRSDPLPYDDVLGRLLEMVEDGASRRVSAEIAFLKKAYVLASQKGGRIRTYVLSALESTHKAEERAQMRPVIYALFAEPGEVSEAMRSAGMASLLHPILPSAKWVIEPWLVNAALERLGDRRLDEAEQAAAVAATRRPHLVRWPDWWVVKPK